MAFNKKKIILWGIGFLLFIVGSFAAYAWLTLHWSYSKGERSGFVQKFSHKGWICKTWEGGTIDGSTGRSNPREIHL